MIKNKQDQDLVTWDDIESIVDWNPEKKKEEPQYIAEIYRKVGSFPFRVRKVASNRHNAADEYITVGFEYSITGKYSEGYIYDGKYGLLLDTKSWVLV